MQVKFTKTAIDQVVRIIDSHLQYSGERSAMKFSELVEDKVNRLSRFPDIGFVEPILAGRQRTYRSLIINSNYKLVYYQKGNTLWVAGVWDMRMHPDRLKGMI